MGVSHVIGAEISWRRRGSTFAAARSLNASSHKIVQCHFTPVTGSGSGAVQHKSSDGANAVSMHMKCCICLEVLHKVVSSVCMLFILSGNALLSFQSRGQGDDMTSGSTAPGACACSYLIR